ncbi:lysophospholipid acyltransferase family protein [Maricaulis sp. CAU 1757]
MRSALFNLAYWTLSVVYALLCAVLACLPSRRLLMHGLRSYARATVIAMRVIAGIRLEVRGTPPRNQPVIIAAKHQSWGDGLVMMAKGGDLAFVTGDHMLKFPLIGFVLKRCGAIVLSNQGGLAAQRSLETGIERAQDDGRVRPVLIYPEGHLTEVGTGLRYRSGVWRLARGLERAVVPVATNLGQCWPQQKWSKFRGTAVIEFLEPMRAGADRDAFLAELEQRTEAASRALGAEFAGPNEAQQAGTRPGDSRCAPAAGRVCSLA